MTAYSRFGAVKARYQNVDLASRVESASPHGLVAILFDELMKSLDAMAAACTLRDWTQRGTAQSRALNMLNGLESSLDLEKGGEIAQSLSSECSPSQHRSAPSPGASALPRGPGESGSSMTARRLRPFSRGYRARMSGSLSPA